MSGSRAAPGGGQPGAQGAMPVGEASGHSAGRWPFLGFVLVALQFALIALLLARFNLETRAFQHLAYISLAGFLVHHHLPGKWRLPFFLALSLGATTYVLGLDQQQWRADVAISRAVPLFGIGLVLIGICHLPARLGVKVGLLVLAGALLAGLRGNWGALSGGGLDGAWIWPVLGSMFMFRLMVYLYDLQHEKGEAQPVRTLSYFFLLPNVCFTLFPVIDYKTFCRAYYNDAALRIYQKGLAWMTRGIVHLLLWRIIYYEFYIDPSRVASGADLVGYIVSNMGLYLRVSGQFHLVIGLLHLFGFNLPETNYRYFLASGFTDYWRRVNLYWKDFIMKLFFYPAIFRLKAWGATWSLVAATVFAFLATWLLHSYQTFWVRDYFPLKSQDLLFWGSLCVLVILSSLHEMKKGRKRSLGGAKVSWKENLGLGARTAATFLVLSTLWSLWSSDSLGQWLGLWEVADADTLVWGAATLAAVFAAAVITEGSWGAPRPGAAPARASGRPGPAAADGFPLRQALVTCMIPAVLLLAVSIQRFHVHLGPGAASLLSSLYETRPNKSDEENMVRGYYEDVMDVGRANPILQAGSAVQPKDWGMLEKTEVYRVVGDYRMYELAPSSRIVLNGQPLSTNQWGMRDREYDLRKPSGTYRIAVLGSSTVMGLNVGDGETFEAVLEEALNRDRAGRPHARYEVLNFAVNGYNPPTQVVVLEKKALAFKPDAVVLVIHRQDIFFTVQRFAMSLRKGVEPIADVFRQVAADARVDARTPEFRAEKRLAPHWPKLVQWSFERIVELCRREGIRPMLVLVNLPGTEGRSRHKDVDRMLELARRAGFTVLSLEEAYGSVDPESLKVAPWDSHPNTRGHRMIAEGLFSALTAESTGLFGPAGTAAADRGISQSRKEN